MVEKINIKESYENKSDLYAELLPQLKSLISSEEDLIANLANVSAVLKAELKYLWVGFYIVKDDQLVLGPFQGPLACTRIDLGKGVCGAAWEKNKTIIVDDVDQFPGHIACSSESRSEIVVPIRKNREVLLVLDVDSSRLSDFDSTDQSFLEDVAKLIEEKLK
ncbi:MAG: GAF domain-containing protein [Bacteroidia bacterium]|nr:GAF domain-containing protein [Bacteroidia bacterium]